MSDTLIVGGLTVDRFTDGTTAPGGSVLHSGVAAVAEGASLTMLTVAGGEEAAQNGLDRLAAMGTLVHQPAPATTTYRHEERDGIRVLVLEASAEAIGATLLGRVGQPAVALVAPIADEVPASLVTRLRDQLAPRLTVLLIQGWLRHLVVGEEVTALPLETLSPEQAAVIAGADAFVVSTEDLVESTGDPFGQAALLRARFGPWPVIVVTLGTEGYLLDDPAHDRVVASVPRRVVTGVPAVGAGDTFGAALAVGLSGGASASAAADRATERVISMLEVRRAEGSRHR